MYLSLAFNLKFYTIFYYLLDRQSQIRLIVIFVSLDSLNQASASGQTVDFAIIETQKVLWDFMYCSYKHKLKEISHLLSR